MHTVDSHLAKLFGEVTSIFLRILWKFCCVSKGSYSYKAQIWEWKVKNCGMLGENALLHVEESLSLVFDWPLLKTTHL